MVANDTNSNNIGISLVHAQIGCSFIAAQPSAPGLGPKGIVLASALSHHIGPPLLLSAQVVASHSDVFLGPFEACQWGGSLAPRQNGLLSGDQGTR